MIDARRSAVLPPLGLQRNPSDGFWIRCTAEELREGPGGGHGYRCRTTEAATDRKLRRDLNIDAGPSSRRHSGLDSPSRLSQGDLDHVARVASAHPSQLVGALVGHICLPGDSGCVPVGDDRRPIEPYVHAHVRQYESHPIVLSPGDSDPSAQSQRRHQSGPAVNRGVLAHENELAGSRGRNLRRVHHRASGGRRVARPASSPG